MPLDNRELSIIIPYHKNRKMFLLSLKTLEETLHGDPEIIVVANNTDARELEFELPSQRYTLYKIRENLFWPGAINYGVSRSHGRYLLFCDPDLFYWPGWLEPLFRCFSCHENVGVVSSKLIDPLTNRIMDFGMAYNRFNVLHTTKGLRYDHPIALRDRKVQAACGAVFLTTREYFDRAGGIDEDMPYIYCDNDYSVKLAKLGLDTWVCADSHVYHKGATDENNSKYYAFSPLREDSKAAFYAKNGSFRRIDAAEWLEYFWSWYLEHTNNRQKNYVCMNFCTLPDKKMYLQIFKENLRLTLPDEYEFVVGQRDAPRVQLYNYIPTELIDCAVPFLYFVDSFTSLFDNEIWFRLRDIRRDLVIDRQGNIINLSDIAAHRV